MTAPTMNLCAVCGLDIDRHDHTTAIGDDTAHAECAQEPEYVTACAHCGQLALNDDVGADWGHDGSHRTCPHCEAEREPESAPAEMQEAVAR